MAHIWDVLGKIESYMGKTLCQWGDAFKMDKAHDDTVPKFTLKLFVLNGIKDKILSCGCISNRLLWLGFSDGSYSCLQTTDSDLVFTQLKGMSFYV